MSIKDWPEDERPRERLLASGGHDLSDAELLAILLRAGRRGESAILLAHRLIERFGGLAGLMRSSVELLLAEPGIGYAKAAQLKAALLIAERAWQASCREKPMSCCPEDVKRLFTLRLMAEPEEVFATLFLDQKHRMIAFKNLFRGSIHEASVHPRVLVREALRLNAAAIIIGHNHPSGDPEPSLADRRLTSELGSLLRHMDIRLLDHVVVGGGTAVSFAEKGWL